MCLNTFSIIFSQILLDTSEYDFPVIFELSRLKKDKTTLRMKILPTYLSLIGTQGNLRNAAIPICYHKNGANWYSLEGNEYKKGAPKRVIIDLPYFCHYFLLTVKVNQDTFWIHSILIIMRLSLRPPLLYWKNTLDTFGYIRYYLVLVLLIRNH